MTKDQIMVAVDATHATSQAAAAVRTLLAVDASGTAAAAVTSHESTYTHGNLPTPDQKAALAGTSGSPADGNRFVTDGDSRLTNARTPSAHASSHTSGVDDIQNATALQKGLATAAQIAKLDGIEAGADVTDAANVAAAGAVMEGDSRLTDDRTPTAHKTSHENGGTDEISVAGLSGALADPQDPKISGQTDIGAALADGDLVAVYDLSGSANKKSAVSRFWTYIWAKVVASTAKTTPVDADSFPLADSADSSAAKLLSWANLKATLKTYFDTMYAASGGTPTAHAASHTDGSDDIQSATDAQKGLATAAQISKLNGIEAAADVTDATNVAAAGAVMEGDSRLTDTRTPKAHKTSHENGGADEISIAGLSGEAADAQTPKAHTQNASTILIPDGIGTPARDDVQDYLNICQSGGRLTGGVLTAHAGPNGTVDISELEGMIHVANTLGSALQYFKKAATESISLTDLSVNYVIITYTAPGGVPTLTYSSSVTHPAENTYNAFVLGRCFRSGNNVETLTTGQNIYDMYGRQQDRMLAKYGAMDHATGAVVSAHATPLRLSCTAGNWYFGNTHISTDAADTFEVWYKTGGGAWTVSSSLTLFSDVFDGGTSKVYETYQNGTSLGALGVSKYGVYWLFVCPEGDLYVVLGTASYSTIGAAQAAAVPASLPPYCVDWARLVGRVIIQKTGAAFYSVESSFATQFTLSAATDHASLANLTAADAHPAASITNTPAGSIAATTVQAAIDELDTEKEPALGNPDVTGYVLSSTDAGVRSWVASSGGEVDRSINMFRVTLESGVAVSTTDQTAKTTIYACPAAGNATEEAQISLLGTDDTTWATHSTAQMSLGLTTTRNGTTTNGAATITGLATTVDLVVGQEVTGTGIGGGAVIASIDSASQVTLSANSTADGTVAVTFKCPASKNYDLFVLDISGTPTFVFGPVWTNDTTRATAITQKDGVPVLTGAFIVGGTSYAEGRLRHVGWVRTAAAGQTELRFGSTNTTTPSQCLLGSVDNKRLVKFKIGDLDSSHNYATGAYRSWNNDANHRINFVLGDAADTVLVFSSAGLAANADAQFALVALATDSTSAVDIAYCGSQVAQRIYALMAGSTRPGIGLHYVQMLEYGNASGAGATFTEFGMEALIWM